MMQLRSKHRRPNREVTAHEKTFPSPVGGWNARDPIGTAGPIDAMTLDNWYPRPAYIEMRGGFTRFITNYPDEIKTVATHILPSGFSVLICYTDTGVSLVTFGPYAANQGDLSGQTLTPAGRTEGRHQWTQFGDGTNTWTIAVNGIDKPLYYKHTGALIEVDGASSPALTGLTTTDIIAVAVFKNRLLFLRKEKLGFDYLPAGAAGGATNYYDLSPFAVRGGYLMAATSWSRDAGDGPDDYAVFITSEGEALVYAGTDPGSATAWALVGVYHIGRPLGRKCVAKFGADPLLLTENGLFPMQALLMSGDERRRFALSYKIEDALSSAAKQYYDHIGWEVVSFPKEDAILVNVPISEGGRYDQYVMNTISKAWCRFTGLNAMGFVVHKAEQGAFPPSSDSHLLFYKGRQIFTAFSGTSDDGQAITFTAEQAFMDFGIPALKEPIMYMPVFADVDLQSYQSGISTDFQDQSGFSSSTIPHTTAGKWGIGQWGIARWGRSGAVLRQWGSVAAWPGRWLSGKLKITSDSSSAKWIGSVMRFNVGSGL